MNHTVQPCFRSLFVVYIRRGRDAQMCSGLFIFMERNPLGPSALHNLTWLVVIMANTLRLMDVRDFGSIPNETTKAEAEGCNNCYGEGS